MAHYERNMEIRYDLIRPTAKIEYELIRPTAKIDLSPDLKPIKSLDKL